MAKARTWSAEKSAKQVREDSVAVARASNAAWSHANKSPLMLKKAKYVGSGKAKKRATMMRKGEEVPVPIKTNRCVRKNAIRTLFSAAAYAATQRLAQEAGEMDMSPQGEATVAAYLPNYAKGVDLLLEQALVAYAQTCFDTAVRIKSSMNMHKKCTAGCMQAACEIVNSSVFSSAGIAPGVVVAGVVKPRKKAAKKAKAAAAEDASVEEA